jgi:hypothetical protein
MSEPAHDEVFCTSCGEIIKEEAEICPECGTRQIEEEESVESDYEIPDMKRHELEKIANKDTTTAILLGIFISPLGYAYVGKWGWAAANFFTLNYLLFGIILVPIHARKIILDAREELRRAGVEGY